MFGGGHVRKVEGLAGDGGYRLDQTPPATPATADLVRVARRGDDPQASAFSTLVRRFERTALAVAYACCGGDASLAGDVTQEAFLRAWTRLGELKDDEKFAAWLCGIVRNLAADARRRGGRRKIAGGVDALAAGENVAAPASHPQRVEQADLIAWALRQLDETSRAAVVLRYYENLSSIAIAELIGSTPAAVDMRLSRARIALRGLLSEPVSQ
jgi:RNA polymerase sigma factor (sigma-70 family)